MSSCRFQHLLTGWGKVAKAHGGNGHENGGFHGCQCQVCEGRLKLLRLNTLWASRWHTLWLLSNITECESEALLLKTDLRTANPQPSVMPCNSATTCSGRELCFDINRAPDINYSTNLFVILSYPDCHSYTLNAVVTRNFLYILKKIPV